MKNITGHFFSEHFLDAFKVFMSAFKEMRGVWKMMTNTEKVREGGNILLKLTSWYVWRLKLQIIHYKVYPKIAAK